MLDSEFLSNGLTYLESAAVASGWQLLVFLVPTLILTALVHLSAHSVERSGIKVLGVNIYIYLFAWLGTISHELGHALFCVVFRHKIKEIKFFSPGSKDGALGYVNHSYEPKNVYQAVGNLFIGIGPVLLGAGVIYLLALLLLGITFEAGEKLVVSLIEYLSGGFSEQAWKRVLETAVYAGQELSAGFDYRSWQFVLFVYLAFSVGSSITLSWSDIKGAWAGLVALVALVFVGNVLTCWLSSGDKESYLITASVLTAFYAVLIFTFVLNSIAALLLKIVALTKSALLG